jgi:para-nitrobenzyl esterase
MSSGGPGMQVTIRSGVVEGRRGPDGVGAFLGIPYAAPPLGERRWRPPQPVAAWSGVRPADAMGPQCPQPPPLGLGAKLLPPEVGSEDCLYCNVWTPPGDEVDRPVAVWIHGGGFATGSGAWPTGETFARDGVVFVTFNYRVGAFGFLYLDESFEGYTGTGNLGLLDQIAALEWVRDNIRAFGGDPDNVTVCGESAGAISVATLLGCPRASGLFRRAIVQSGSAQHVHPRSAATRIARRFCEIAGIEAGDVETLASLPAESIREASSRLVFVEALDVAGSIAGDDPLCSNIVFAPVVDDVLLTERPIDAIRAGSARGMPLIVGTNADEWRLVNYGMGPEVARLMPPPDLDRLGAGTARTGSALLDEYQRLFPGKDDIDLYCEIQSDWVFHVPSRRLADAQAAQAPVYVYSFDWPTPVMEGLLGSCHALEIPFVFDQLARMPDLVGGDPPQFLADTMHRAWLSFMRDGTVGAPWPRYDADDRRILRLGAVVEPVVDDFPKRSELWPRW